MKLQLRVTAAAMRWIDKAGGFDGYVYHTPDHKLASKLGVALKRRMHKTVKCNPDISPPPLVKRYPRPPRSVTQTIIGSPRTGDSISTNSTVRSYSTSV